MKLLKNTLNSYKSYSKKNNLLKQLAVVSLSTLLISITVAKTFATNSVSTTSLIISSSGALSIDISEIDIDLGTNITFNTEAISLTGGETVTITLEDTRGTLTGWEATLKFKHIMAGAKIVEKSGNGSATLDGNQANSAPFMNKSGSDWTDSAHCIYTVIIDTDPTPDQYAVTKGDNADAGEECEDTTTMQTAADVGTNKPIGGIGNAFDFGGTPSDNDTFYVTMTGFEYKNYGWTFGATTGVNNAPLKGKTDGTNRTRGAPNSGSTLIDSNEATAESDPIRILKFDPGTGGGKYTKTINFELDLPAGPRLLKYANSVIFEII